MCPRAKAHHRCADELIDQVGALLEAAEARHTDRHADETFSECLLCGEWDSHTDACPVPAIYRWLETEPDKARG